MNNSKSLPINNERFICYLALKNPDEALSDNLCQKLQSQFPETVKVLGVPTPRSSITKLGHGYTVGFGDTELAIMFVDSPLPVDAWERSVELDRIWPESRAAMVRQKAHVIVSNVKAATTHDEAIFAASAVSITAATLTGLLETEAVVWASGQTIVEPSRFIVSIHRFEQKQIPIDIWMGMTWLDGEPTAKGERTLAVITSGLRHFVGRELEFMPTELPPTTILDRVLSTAQYLTVNGPVLADGDTLGINKNERIRVHYEERGIRPNIPVIQLTVERIEPPSSIKLPGLGGDTLTTGNGASFGRKA